MILPTRPGRMATAVALRSASSWLAVVVVLLLFGRTAAAELPEPIRFNEQIRPILSNRCFACHGPDEKQRESDLRLDTYEGATESFAIVPGDPEGSELLARVAAEEDELLMPPPAAKKPRLTEQEISLIRRWIEQGARYDGHWAFQPLREEGPPEVQEPGWVRNAIDQFILARLEHQGLRPSPEADRPTLIRRVYLDLLGLLPPPEEVERFVNDSEPGAYERLVDRLLQSPHYGERWGRHWLDQARYADSHGYSIDSERQMWPYREWVIRAFNEDLPFDRFTIEQLAGDLLPGPTRSQLAATAFHRNTLINQEGGTDREQFRVEAAMDRVNTTGAVWLGLTVSCAQCHTHKFDPITHREYYQLYAFFNSARDANDRGPTIEVARGEMLGIARPRKPDPDLVQLMILRDLPQPRPTFLLTRGDFTRPDKEAGSLEPGVLEAVPPELSPSEQPRTRLDLARWLVHPDNPLTPRVTVNRLWMRYFGSGLVETEEDFGTQGTPPTHPALLDWLGREFMRRGWSLKQMHRLIVTSGTYRQSSQLRPELREKDPRNRLLARQQRLRVEAEIVRDAALCASGLLDRTLGGPSVHPPQPDGVYAFTQTSKRWNTATGSDRYRRAMYTFFYRSSPYPLFTTFDAPDFQSVCTRRLRSNTPLQSLTLANDAAFVEIARGLARRLARELPGDARQQLDARLERAFQLCLSRSPSARERALLGDYFLRQLEEFSGDPAAAEKLAAAEWTQALASDEAAALVCLARVVLNTDNFITRE